MHWVPNSETHLIYTCMQHKCFRVFEAKKSGKNLPLVEMRMNEQSGVIRDFCIVENVKHPN